MAVNKVDFRATTKAVLEGFSHDFTDMVIQLLNRHNTIITAEDGESKDIYTDVSVGNGLLVMTHYGEDNKPFTMETEFLVPSYELAAAFMVMWRRWCDKRSINSHDGLLSLMNRIATENKKDLTQDDIESSNNLAIGLMGAALDNYPEIVNSMRWSTDRGFSPCLVIANDNNLARCGVCYGGKYQ